MKFNLYFYPVRKKLVKQRSYYEVQITNTLDIIFSKLKPTFNNSFSATLFFILNKYKAAEKIANMHDYNSVNNISRGNFSYAKFLKIKELENKIEEIIKELDPPALSMKGVGIISCASIIVEFGDMSRFKSADGAMSFHICNGKIIDIVEDRRLNSLIKYFSFYTHKARSNVKLIVIDMYNPYISLIKKMFPNAKIIIDKFHIVNLISTSLNKTRIKFMKKSNKDYRKLKRYWNLLLIEGNNNFIKVLKRIVFGFKSFRRFKARIMICKGLINPKEREA